MEIVRPAILVFKVFMYLTSFFPWISEPSKECKLEKAAPKMLVIFQPQPAMLCTSMACCSKAAFSSFTPRAADHRWRWNHRWPLFSVWENCEILMKIYEICWVYNNLYCCIVSVRVLLLRKLWDSKKSLTLPETNMFAHRNGGETNKNLRNSRGQNFRGQVRFRECKF